MVTAFIKKLHTKFTSFFHHGPFSNATMITLTSIIFMLHLEQHIFPSCLPFQFKTNYAINPKLSSPVRSIPLHCIFYCHDNQPMIIQPRNSLTSQKQSVFDPPLRFTSRTIILNNIPYGNEPYLWVEHWYNTD